MVYEIELTLEFHAWYSGQTVKTKAIIDGRLARIREYGHFGTHKRFDRIIELKWKSGMRIYTFLENNRLVIVLKGGTKHGQQKDIDAAKKIIAKRIS